MKKIIEFFRQDNGKINLERLGLILSLILGLINIFQYIVNFIKILPFNSFINASLLFVSVISNNLYLLSPLILLFIFALSIWKSFIKKTIMLIIITMFLINLFFTYIYFKSDKFYQKNYETVKKLEVERKVSDALSYCRIANLYNNDHLIIAERRLFNKLLISTSLMIQYNSCKQNQTNVCFEILKKGVAISNSFDDEKKLFSLLLKDLTQMSLNAHLKLKENKKKECRLILIEIEKKFKNFGYTKYMLDAINNSNDAMIKKFKEMDSKSYNVLLEKMYVI